MINFSLSEASDVNIDILNLKGQCVKTLLNARFESGRYSVSWNGTDSENNPVASGIYFYQMKTGNYSEIKKCILLK
jgi:flagellar hook assembly protein FlgD